MTQTKKSTFKLLFYLKKNELKKNGNAPIMARITIDGAPKTFGTKLEIDPSNWDLKYERVEGKSATALNINKKLDNIRGRIDKIYEDMLKHEGFATSQKVKLSFLGVGVMDDAILKVFNDKNEDFKKLVDKEERSQSTYNKYITVYNHLAAFIKERYHRDDMAFRELTGDFIREFDFYLRYDLQSTHNTVWVYTMPVLSLVELAIKKSLIRDNPFQDYEINMEETDRGYILKEDVEKLMMCAPPHPRYELVKDLFIFSCFTGLAAGIPFFKYDWKKEVWNLFFVFGIFLGGAIAFNLLSNPAPIEVNPKLAQELAGYGITNYNNLIPEDIMNWQSLFTLKGFILMVAGGFLVGFGTRYAGGCTSGHAIMGLSNLQLPSLIATICFMIGGFIMANLFLPFILSL